MAFFCRCSAATGEAALEDGDSAIRQEGDAQLSHMEDVSLQLAKQDQSLGIDEKASEHSTVTPSIQEISMELPTLEAEEKIGKAPEANPLEEVEATEAAPEVKPEPQKAEEKVKRPPEPLTTLDDQNFDDRGVSTLDESKTFYYTLGNDYRCLLTGWTHTRPYAKGFIRNKPGTGKAVVSGLDHGVGYFWKVYQVAKLHGSANGLSVNGEDQGKTNASKSYEATASGKTLADKEGKITFAFTRDGDEVHLSGIAVAREEEKEGKPKPKAKAKVKAKAKNKGKEPKYDEVGRRIDRRKKEESSSDEDLLDDLCPSSRKDADFERELKKMKKKVRAGMTEKQREEMENPWLYTQISDGERSLKKDMFKSFYREQYARLKKSAGPDLKQYQKNDPATGQSVGTSNLKAEGGHRPLPRPKGVKMPKDFQKVTPWGPTTARGARTRGKSLIPGYFHMGWQVSACWSRCTDRPDKYGPDGPYWYMTGKDITWALVSGEDSEENMDKFYDIFKIQPQDAADRRLQGLMSWWAFYEKEYGKPVGRNTSYDKEWGLPPPPNIADGCSVM